MVRRFRFLTLAFVGILGCSGAASAAEKPAAGKAAAEITSPENGATVQLYDSVEGRLTGRDGWPVVVVQPQTPEEPWFVQGPVESVDDGEFTARTYFGNERTPVGTKFRLVILVAPSQARAREFSRGMELRSLPKFPKSKTFTVTRGK